MLSYLFSITGFALVIIFSNSRFHLLLGVLVYLVGPEGLLDLVDPEFLFYYYLSIIIFVKLIFLQNSTELKKFFQMEPVLHSYFLLSVGIWYNYYRYKTHRILEP